MSDDSSIRAEYAPYIKAWRKRWQAEDKRLRKQANEARLLADHCAQLLADK